MTVSGTSPTQVSPFESLSYVSRDPCTVLQERQSDPIAGRWVFKATIYKRPVRKSFVGYAAMPIPPTSLPWSTAPKCALLKPAPSTAAPQSHIGLCSVETGAPRRSTAPTPPVQRKAPANGSHGHQNGQPRLRDRFCLLIRQHHLDAGLVKAYAADYCGTATRGMPPEIRSKPLSTIWPSVPPKIETG